MAGREGAATSQPGYSNRDPEPADPASPLVVEVGGGGGGVGDVGAGGGLAQRQGDCAAQRSATGHVTQGQATPNTVTATTCLSLPRPAPSPVCWLRTGASPPPLPPPRRPTSTTRAQPRHPPAPPPPPPRAASVGGGEPQILFTWKFQFERCPSFYMNLRTILGCMICCTLPAAMQM